MPLLIYSLLRVAMFVAAGGLLWLAGLRGWLLVLAAIVVAALVSFLALPRQANAAAGVVAGTVERRQGRIDRATGADGDVEDALLDADGEGSPAPGAASPDGAAGTGPAPGAGEGGQR